MVPSPHNNLAFFSQQVSLLVQAMPFHPFRTIGYKGPSNAQAELRGLMISRRAAVSSSLLLGCK
jgi:hypothetical protein